MKSARFALFAALLALLAAGCGPREPAGPLSGLSESEKRAAKAYAATLCSIARGSMEATTLADASVAMADMAEGVSKGRSMEVVKAGVALARAEKCVPATALLPSEKPKAAPAAVAPAPPAPPEPMRPNNNVADSLNSADTLFKSDMNGCLSVDMAITFANAPSTFGPTPPEQRQEVKRYADKCGLRFYP